VSELKPAYLIHGDDHGRIGERRRRLRDLAERESGAQGVEVFTGETSTVEAVVTALSAMTFAVGRRFLIVDGVERWSERDLEPLARVLVEPPPETTVAFFGREEGRTRIPEGLARAVKACGGDVALEAAVKPWELPRWVQARAVELGFEIHPAAAKALVALVGERQQRLLRELEKLSLSVGAGAAVDVGRVEELAASSAERRAWSLADALVAADAPAAVRCYLDLRAQGERLTGLLYVMVQRLRIAHDVARRLEAGESPAQVKRGLRMPPKAAERMVADVQRTDAALLRRTLQSLADLELASRGGGRSGLSEDTLALEAIAGAAA
jgi:DNA polymerase-3 subunit delta